MKEWFGSFGDLQRTEHIAIAANDGAYQVEPAASATGLWGTEPNPHQLLHLVGGPHPFFWDNIAAKGGPAFVDAVDFVSHNFYVDVFESPVDLGEISSRVEAVVRDLRFRDLVSADMPASVPIRVAENGWPTGTNPFTNVARPYERQAEVIDSVVQAVHRLRSELNISHYMVFDPRDADSSNPDMFHQFGVMRDDYSAKPAYNTFKGLVRQFSQ